MRADDAKLKRLAARVGRRLGGEHRCVVTAESCTGGWIAKALTDVAGSSQWFGEGFVIYSNESKIRRLGVPRALLGKKGAVSEEVVRAMAAGALRRTQAHVAVAVTGIAGPDGAVPGRPFGWDGRRAAAAQYGSARNGSTFAATVNRCAARPCSWRSKGCSREIVSAARRTPKAATFQSVYTVVGTRPLLYER
jgi:nicotinamide-nucleotide amidase